MHLHFIEPNPRRLAEAHRTDDLLPAAREAACALAAAALRFNPREDLPITPEDPPPALVDWAAASRSNWAQLTEIGFALLFEHNWRGGTTDGDVRAAFSWARSNFPYNMPELGLTGLPVYTPDEYTYYVRRKVDAWRLCYIDAEDFDPDDWAGRDVPQWYLPLLRQMVSGRAKRLEELTQPEPQTETE